MITSDFSPNTDPGLVPIGPAYRQAEAWVYLPLVNATSRKRNLVIELDHNRCDTLEAFLLTSRKRKPVRLGHLFRRLPLDQRPIPVREFALPFTLAPRDSVGLLLHSQRTTGIHELSISLSTKTQFIIHHEQDQLMRLSALMSAFFLVFTVCSLGLMFKHWLLVHFGLYMLAIALGLLNYNYFFDDFPFPTKLGLNANSIGLFMIFLGNAMLHPFGLAYLQSLTRFKGWWRYAVGLLAGGNLLQMLLLLPPLTPLTNSVATQASLILTTLTIGWLFYISILGFIQTREKYLLLTVTLVFVPLLYRTYSQPAPALNYSYFQPFYYLLVFGFLIVALLRRELISRQMTQHTIQLVQTSLEQFRKAEIEQIGRNLHDQLGNTLASALGYLTMQLPRVGLARQMILEAISETRIISHNLVKDDERLLNEKLNDLAERFNDFSSIRFTYYDFTDRQINQLTPLKQQNIYLIVQEVLNNVIKHSQANEVTIQAFVSKDIIWVSIDDDGIGYPADTPSRGIGITNMHKRAELASLVLVIDGGPKGTSVTIETPLAG